MLAGEDYQGSSKAEKAEAAPWEVWESRRELVVQKTAEAVESVCGGLQVKRRRNSSDK